MPYRNRLSLAQCKGAKIWPPRVWLKPTTHNARFGPCKSPSRHWHSPGACGVRRSTGALGLLRGVLHEMYGSLLSRPVNCACVPHMLSF